MNWTELTEECCYAQGCAISQLPKLTVTTASKRIAQDLLTRRESIHKVAVAVQKAREANPNGTREQIHKQAVKFILGSIIFFFLGNILLNLVMRMALDWFLARLFKSE